MKHTTHIKDAGTTADVKQLKVTSTAFQNGELIPFKYSCDGANVNPPLYIDGIPENTKSLAVIVDDTDTPKGTWGHWVIWNIPVTQYIKEYGTHGTEGTNDFHQQRYIGPCPLLGVHRYSFKIFALDSLLYLPPHTTKSELEEAMNEHITAFGELIGLYKDYRTNDN